MELNKKKNDPILVAWWSEVDPYIQKAVENSELTEETKQILLATCWQLLDSSIVLPSVSVFEDRFFMVWRYPIDADKEYYLEYEFNNIPEYEGEEPERSFYYHDEGRHITFSVAWNPGDLLPKSIKEVLRNFEV